eukprot:XP_001708965.1 Hypothetical protein GL50803_29179 [Giardia lamblia ATCC 50803]
MYSGHRRAHHREVIRMMDESFVLTGLGEHKLHDLLQNI